MSGTGGTDYRLYSYDDQDDDEEQQQQQQKRGQKGKGKKAGKRKINTWVRRIRSSNNNNNKSSSASDDDDYYNITDDGLLGGGGGGGKKSNVVVPIDTITTTMGGGRTSRKGGGTTSSATGTTGTAAAISNSNSSGSRQQASRGGGGGRGGGGSTNKRKKTNNGTNSDRTTADTTAITSSTSSGSTSCSEEVLGSKEPQDMENLTIQLLSTRTYCLPGNTWCQDYMWFFRNYHPVFCICFAHPLHPFKVRDRLMCLVASISFGLAATCGVYLYFYYENAYDINDTVLQFSSPVNWFGFEADNGSGSATGDDDAVAVAAAGGDDGGADGQQAAAGEEGDSWESIGATASSSSPSFQVTYGMLALWTFGGAAHSMFDLLVWYTTSCFCCRRGGICACCGLSWLGSYVSLFVTTLSLSLALYTVTLRATLVEEDNNGDGQIDEGIQSFLFLKAYGIELMLTWFIMYPMMATVFFTGVLGCRRLPVIGGRPFEKAAMDRSIARIQKKQAKRDLHKRGVRLQVGCGHDEYEMSAITSPITTATRC